MFRDRSVRGDPYIITKAAVKTQKALGRVMSSKAMSQSHKPWKTNYDMNVLSKAHEPALVLGSLCNHDAVYCNSRIAI